MKKLLLYITTLFTLMGCINNTCHCVETTTQFYPYRVTVEEYWVDECNHPFIATEAYNWGNRITDCR